MVKVLSPMIKSKLAFLQMQIEGAFVDPAKTDETGFRIAPESFNPVHMRTTSDKFIFAVIDAEMFSLSHIDQPVIASPPIRIAHTVHGNLPTNNRLQRRLSAVRDKFRVDLSIALENPKDDRLAVRPSSAFPFNAARSKGRFIDFDFATERRLGFAEFSNPLSKSPNIPIDRVAVQPSQEGNL